mmetsp:Transcript_23505/g.43292  ORF Transcript_23505/g.43292 Transcript_23505/m.43292 type:complete len:485 (-) Transcript_23505:31-1485(-)
MVSRADIVPAKPSQEATSFFRSPNLILLCAVAVADGADQQLLFSSFRALEADLHLELVDLLWMQLAQGVAAACAGPFWAAFVDSGARHRVVLSIGAMGWGTVTVIMAGLESLWMAVLLRGAAGFFMASLLPVVQSMTAEVVERSSRGRAFGLVDFSSKMGGQMLTTLFVTSISNRLYLGLPGWRIGFLVIGLLSCMLAGIVCGCMEDKPRPWKPDQIGVFAELKKLLGFLQVRTFAIIVAQGIVGTIPWVALNLTTLYFQYAGMPDARAALAFSFCLVGQGIGTFAGGCLGDWFAAWSPYHGRTLVAQTSVMLGMPVVFIMFYVLPAEPWTFAYQAVLAFVLGLVATWCANGCNKPIFIDIVPEDSTASACAWEFCIQNAFANIAGNAALNIVSGFFGYSRAAADKQVSEMTQGERLLNAHALGNALLFSLLFFWGLCFFLYSTLHLTYKSDCMRLNAEGVGETTALLNKEVDQKTAGSPATTL